MVFFVETAAGKQTFYTADGALAEVCEKQINGVVAEVHTDSGKRFRFRSLLFWLMRNPPRAMWREGCRLQCDPSGPKVATDVAPAA